MSERISIAELCTNCPNRTSISRMLGKLSSKSIVGTDCEGVVTVNHGIITTEVRQKNEPSPPKHLWSSVTTSMDSGERRYSGIKWSHEDICGKEEVKPGVDEVYNGSGEYVKTDSEGRRRAVFVSGDEQSLRDHRYNLAIMHLLDGVGEHDETAEATDLDEPEDSNDKPNT
jgi:hypothetical protein